MNFFKTVFSDELDPSQPATDAHLSDRPDPDQGATSNAAWSFGGLIQTLASKSESVLDNYRRDLDEFSSGLKKETAVIREAASRAVKDLPVSLDAGASVAQESLESVGQAIDDIGSSFWKSTAQIIAHGRDSLVASDFDSDSFDSTNNDSDIFAKKQLSSSRYSRFDALVRALQCDVNTYVEEPEDLGNYNEWKLGFELDDKREEIGNLNGVVEEIYGKAVPSRTDHESFWSRYFYKLHKLKQAEDARAKLVKRAMDEEEDLNWDFDDEDDHKGSSSAMTEHKDLKIENVVAPEAKTDGADYDENAASNVPATVSDIGDEEKEASQLKTDNDNGGSCKDSDISVVSSQPSMPGEEEIGWDEIEDIESNDENKGDAVGSTSRIDLRKRLSVADQDEDLSWDIEDGDEAVKS